MKRLNCEKIKVMFFVFMSVVVLGDGISKADFTFGEPVNVQSTIPSMIDCFSADGLEMYIEGSRADGQGGCDLWVCKRASSEDDWGAPENLGPTVNSTSNDFGASISADGLEFYFTSDRPGGSGDWDLWVTRRATRNSPWAPAANLSPNVNTSYTDYGPSVSSDGLELYLSSNRPGGHGIADIYVSKRATPQDPWGRPTELDPTVSSPSYQEACCLSTDGLLLLFQSGRPGGFGDCDLWLTRRASRSAPWGLALNLGPGVNGPTRDCRACIAPDGSALYFVRSSGGVSTRLMAPILPVVDFNADSKVDLDDLRLLVDNWGTDNTLCDIGPMPWGDGVVDVRDLEVLIKYIEPIDYTLIAHWTLDETEGMFAHNSVNGDDDYVLGSAIWQPADGMIDGALELDGIDDCVISNSVFNPAEGSFSVFAWIKCSTPGKTIISQPNGSDWLAMDADGNLMTGLAGSGNSAVPLISQKLIADDQWHRIGFVWNGSQRMLCVDGVSVAEDTQDGLVGLNNGIYIGVGKNFTAGTFFSGLIDDVQIYKGAVNP
jgi:hypothetical protein